MRDIHEYFFGWYIVLPLIVIIINTVLLKVSLFDMGLAVINIPTEETTTAIYAGLSIILRGVMEWPVK